MNQKLKDELMNGISAMDDEDATIGEIFSWIDTNFLAKIDVEVELMKEENILDAHNFFINRVQPKHSRCCDQHFAYDYAGGEINGRNRLRRELREKLELNKI